jgi:hypothetical protein
MLKPFLWIVLALHALAQSGLQARGLAQPSPAGASQAAASPGEPGQAQDLAQRRAAWQRLRILDMNDDGEALRNGQWIGRDAQMRLYGRHEADDSMAMLRKARAHAFFGGCGLWLLPAALAAAGADLGQQSDIEHGVNGSTSTNPGTTIGTAGGAVLGLLIGIPWYLFQGHEAADLRAGAAERYNRKILEELELGAAPMPGGATLAVRAKF